MTKKKSSARPNIPQETLDRARRQAGLDVPPTEEREPAAKEAKSGPVTASTSVQTAQTVETLAKEYAYVIVDLRNMAILATALFIFLVILALVL